MDRFLVYDDGVDTGEGGPRKLRIAGRPKAGLAETYTIVEEPGEPVLMHYDGKHMPHMKQDCKICAAEDADEPVPFWYVGAAFRNGLELEPVILELTKKEFRSLETAARNIELRWKLEFQLYDDESLGVGAAPVFTGLVVKIARSNFDRSPRVLRCEHRAKDWPKWPFETRRELCRIWDIRIPLRIHKENA